MALDVFFASNIERAICANTLAVILASIAHGARNVEFVRGVLCLAQSQALAFGLDWPAMIGELHSQAQLQGIDDLLSAASQGAIEG